MNKWVDKIEDAAFSLLCVGTIRSDTPTFMLPEHIRNKVLNQFKDMPCDALENVRIDRLYATI